MILNMEHIVESGWRNRFFRYLLQTSKGNGANCTNREGKLYLEYKKTINLRKYHLKS